MTKEQDFKQRFAALLQDLQQDGSKNPKAMYLLGSLASDLARDLKQTTWTAAKSVMTPARYTQLLKRFQEEGQSHHEAKRTEAAYAIQALAMSLVVGTQRTDPEMVTGEQLLDSLIDRMVALYQARPKAN